MQDWLKQVTLQGPSINAYTYTLGYIFTGESSYRIGRQRLNVEPIRILCCSYRLEENTLYSCNHGLIKYIDTKAKCRHLKTWHVMDFAAGVYQNLQSVMLISSTQLCELLPLLPSLRWDLPPFPPYLCKYTVCTYTVRRGWGVGIGFWASDR